MHKTIYIDIDEEITSIIDKIRREPSQHIFLVVPKNAMLTQGLLNLRLLRKQADHLGKSVMLVTNDPQAKKVIERAGLITKPKAPANPTPSEPLGHKQDLLPEQAAIASVEELTRMSQEPSEQREIGSTSFFDGDVSSSMPDDLLGSPDPSAQPHSQLPAQAIPPAGPHIRPAVSPAAEPTSAQPTLSAIRTSFSPPTQPPPIPKSDGIVMPPLPPRPTGAMPGIPSPLSSSPASQSAPAGIAPLPVPPSKPDPRKPIRQAQVPQNRPPENVRQPMPRPIVPPAISQPSQRIVQPPAQPHPRQRVPVDDKNVTIRDLFGNSRPKEEAIPISQGLEGPHRWNEKEAEDFFMNIPAAPSDQASMAVQSPQSRSDGIGRPVMMILKIVGLISLLVAIVGGAVFWAFARYPIASVTIYPATRAKEVVLTLTASGSVSQPDAIGGMIPGVLKDVEISTTADIEPTGEKFATDDGKARGKVTITNKYSSSPQTLVATTRVLSKEGKLFRLVNQATVPGMDGDTPGSVEVSVIADKPGSESNIGPSTFTIEGFKGGPKYEAFEVASNAPMGSGSDGGDNRKVKVVTAKDIEQARQAAVDQLDRTMLSEISKQLGSNELILPEAAEKEIIASKASHKEGEVASTLSYTITEKVRGIVISEPIVEEMVRERFSRELESGYEIKQIQPAEFTKGIADLGKKTMQFEVHASGMIQPIIDAENVRRGIVGKSEPAMRSFLSGYAEIERIEIAFTPSWLSRVPVSEKKITVSIQEQK